MHMMISYIKNTEYIVMCIYCDPDQFIDVLEMSIIAKDVDCGLLGDITLNLWIYPSMRTLEMEVYTKSHMFMYM